MINNAVIEKHVRKKNIFLQAIVFFNDILIILIKQQKENIMYVYIQK